ncbi:hypothetical protein Mapa_016935 [Marchantia paleacea]|nr:hypothetical protein Mapa_016935 [Marchantia paleacea]
MPMQCLCQASTAAATAAISSSSSSKRRLCVAAADGAASLRTVSGRGFQGLEIRELASIRRPNPNLNLPACRLARGLSNTCALVVTNSMGLTSNVALDGPLVVKAPSDKRLYQVVHLKNGLSALLIHDPQMAPKPDGSLHSDDSGEDDDEEDDDEEEDDEEEDEDDMEGEEESGSDDADDVMGCDDCENGVHAHDHHEHEHDDGDDEDESDEEDGSRVPSSGKNGMAPTKKAAAAMSVGMGSFSDPADAQGLAHFLEHMLFMGSSKFPDENEYDNFLSKHGGGSNAFTDTEYTCYHFDVNRKFLKPALERFSQFFISPLAKADAMDREVQAIDSEFNQVLQSDSCRLLQLMCHTADKNHPFHTFSWGNKKSLGDPMRKGVDMRGKMLELYKKNYLAGRMKLSILGGESLETLKEWAVELFGEVKEGGNDKKSPTWSGPIWEKGKFYRVESVKDQHLLSLMWPLPCLEAAYLKKPQDYISHLVGHEGAGSLLSLLKEKGWATALSAGVGEGGYERSTVGYMFNVNIYLTVVGLDKVLDVVDFLYQYIKMLRDIGPQEWVFKELQSMGMMEFKFAEEDSADNYVVRLASNMHLFSEDHIIYGDYAFEEWDPKFVNDLLALITPDNMRLDLVTRQFDRSSPDVQIEPWFEVPYLVESLPESRLETWANPPSVDPALHMPVVNEFIPHDFSIISPEAVSPDGPDVPKILVDGPMLKIWYKLDKTFEAPRANTYFSITCPAAVESVKASVITEVYIKLLEDALNETIYLANVAKLESSMSFSGDKLEVKLFGFNEKLSVLARKIAELYKAFVPSEDRFQAIKEDMERAYRNVNMKPLKHSAYLRLQVLKERFFHADDKLECLLKVKLQDVKDFVPKLFEQTYMEALCHGNLTESEAMNIANIFKSALVKQELPAELRGKERVYKLPTGPCHLVKAKVKNESEDNSVVEMYFQVGQDLGQPSIRSRAVVDIFEEIVYEPCFNQLRTKEQLGYRVDCGVRVTHRIMGFCFRVQSAKYSPPYLEERINAFIATIQQTLADMSDEEFTNYKEALIADKMERDHTLIEETDRHWEQICEQRYSFEARKLEAMEVQTLEKSDVIDWYNQYISSGSPGRRKLSVHIWGSNTETGLGDLRASTPEETIAVDNFASFKSSLELFPALT